MSDLVGLDAVDLAARIRAREVSSREVMQAHLARIARVDRRTNAIVSRLGDDAALALADEADAALARGESIGPLHGLPVAIKDAVDVAGFPTTRGSKLFAGSVAKQDALLTRRMKAAGLLVIGKTNMPELGLGSHTFNPVFGVTRNPFDLGRTAGGSSGGAAAALAARLLPLADGSDLGGSLRNPAAFCNVLGIRPSIGRVPAPDAAYGWLARLTTQGPMGRSVRDVAALLAVQAGPDPRDPLSLPESGDSIRGPLERDVAGLRVGYTADLGSLPVETAIREVCAGAARVFERDMGCEVDAAHPDLGGAMDVFQVQRAALLAPLARELEAARPDWREVVKETAVWNLERGLALDGAALVRSEVERKRIHLEVLRFFERYDFLILPTTQVAPFPVEVEWVREIEGQRLDNYLDWMRICCLISVTALPALSMPCGFTAEGLPVGLQIVGPPGADFEVLRLARAFERATGHAARTPPEPEEEDA